MRELFITAKGCNRKMLSIQYRKKGLGHFLLLAIENIGKCRAFFY
jgi:hypothetical protein